VSVDVSLELWLPVVAIGMRQPAVLRTHVEEAAMREEDELKSGNHDVWLAGKICTVAIDAPAMAECIPHDLCQALFGGGSGRTDARHDGAALGWVEHICHIARLAVRTCLGRPQGASNMIGPAELPDPDSAVLREQFPNEEVRIIYRLLYDAAIAGAEPPTMLEIRERVAQILGRSHAQTDRRLRDLRRCYDIVTVMRTGRDHGYLLVGPRSGGPLVRRGAVSSRAEAKVFAAWGARCADCGRTPRDDAVKLVIDHIVPLDWGGTNDEKNLRPLCEFHNHGKQAWVSSLDPYAPAIRAAISLDEVHLRIGELLKALQGEQVSVDLVNAVAREENRGDPTRRLRDLRKLGWTIVVRRRKVGLRTISFYRLEHWEPWPPEGPAAAVARLEADRRRRKSHPSG
jgi:5-methylcytosine-specific restriction endonuclease McrA